MSRNLLLGAHRASAGGGFCESLDDYVTLHASGQPWITGSIQGGTVMREDRIMKPCDQTRGQQTPTLFIPQRHGRLYKAS